MIRDVKEQHNAELEKLKSQMIEIRKELEIEEKIRNEFETRRSTRVNKCNTQCLKEKENEKKKKI